MSWRQSYKSRFVAASSSSSSGSLGSFGNVPPPKELAQPNAAAQRALSKDERRELNRQKEAEYDNLIYGEGRAPGSVPSASTSSAASQEKRKLNERKRRIEEDDYLEDDSDEEAVAPSKPAEPQVNEEEEDELEAFMAGIEKQAKKDKDESINKELKNKEALTAGKAVEPEGGQKGRADIDEEDMQESYFTFLEEQKLRAVEEDEIHEYDEDGNIIWTWKKVIDPLPPIDHSQVAYKSFKKNFYHEHEQIHVLFEPFCHVF
ncbi:hypothetical protein L596_030929 [Steinernema carpocapsae]|uniref:Uncharacterized protein n=1 Tax=Steinernema carpocapsae TaxID=34508 RepID=A0A4U5MHW7_STECR|nr:hypothetical protein L596_030929 [Steinernema carpocapsae]